MNNPHQTNSQTISQTSNQTEKKKVLMCWSGGKDSAMALHKVQQEYNVVGLLTTLSAEFKRISMHGIREEVLDAQAEAIGLPLTKVWVGTTTNQEYETQMTKAMTQAKLDGVEHIVFGDIFLQDLREYREFQLAKVGLTAVFPLWQSNTAELIQYFIETGFKTITCCINDGYLDASWAGREIDQDFVSQLPENIDPCGENGEYHTFCYAGPIYKQPVAIVKGEVVYRELPKPMSNTGTMSPTANDQTTEKDKGRYECKSVVETKGFWFCDVLLA